MNETFRVFAWNLTEDGIDIKTFGFKTKKEATEFLSTIRSEYENYTIVEGTDKIQKTWEYLSNLNKEVKE